MASPSETGGGQGDPGFTSLPSFRMYQNRGADTSCGVLPEVSLPPHPESPERSSEELEAFSS